MMDSLLRLTLSLNRSRKFIEILKKAVSERMCTDSRPILWKSKKNQQQCNGWTLCLALEIVNPLLDFEWVLRGVLLVPL